MQKYCLTDCFKKKMSKGWQEVLLILVLALMVCFVAALVVGLGYLIGITAHWFGYGLDRTEWDLGGSAIIIIGLTSAIGVFVYDFVKNITKSLIKKYNNRGQCHIFEKCKEEENNEHD